MSAATAEGRPKTPLPMIEFTTSATRLQRPMARTRFARGAPRTESSRSASGATFVIGLLYHGSDDFLQNTLRSPETAGLRSQSQVSLRVRFGQVLRGRRREHFMINGKRIAVVMPAYNAEKTLAVTAGELPDLIDINILVDDHSSDRTVELARGMGLQVFQHDRNYGYGRNQQTCYREALAAGADVVIMLHPDYQYTPLLVTAMASMVAYE